MFNCSLKLTLDLEVGTRVEGTLLGWQVLDLICLVVVVDEVLLLLWYVLGECLLVPWRLWLSCLIKDSLAIYHLLRVL